MENEAQLDTGEYIKFITVPDCHSGATQSHVVEIEYMLFDAYNLLLVSDDGGIEELGWVGPGIDVHTFSFDFTSDETLSLNCILLTDMSSGNALATIQAEIPICQTPTPSPERQPTPTPTPTPTPEQTPTPTQNF